MTTPIDPRVDLYIDGAWTDITDDVRYSAGISINRGKSSETASVEPSRLTMTLSNADGKYSPRNPVSPYFQKIGRNTPIRTSVAARETYLNLPALDAFDGSKTADKASLDITGDIDIRAEFTMVSWRRLQGLAAKYNTGGDQRSWALQTDADGFLTFAWTPLGTLASRISISSTVSLPFRQGRHAVRVTLDVNNGAGGNTVTFYTSDSVSGSWTILGSAVTTSGTTSIYSGNADLEFGTAVLYTGIASYGRGHAFELRSGIGGTVVANPDFSSGTPGGTVVDTGSTPNTWASQVNAIISDREYRMYGEVSSWPQKWDVSGNDVWVDLEAAGILRRLGQGASPLDSTMFKGITGDTANPVVAYWPIEDESGSYGVAAGITGVTEGDIDGTVDLGTVSTFPGSRPVAAMGSNGRIQATIPGYTVTGETQVRFLISIPSGGVAANRVLATMYCSGTARRIDLVNGGTTGTLYLAAYNEFGVLIDSTTLVAFNITNDPGRISIEMTQNGANVDTVLGYFYLSTGTPLIWSETLTGCTVGRVTRIDLAPDQNLGDVAYGHLSLQRDISSQADLRDQILGYSGERAGSRMARLCREQGIAFRLIGQESDTEYMGPQGAKTFVDLMEECATADMGQMFETRDALGLGYRTRVDMYNRDPSLSLDYDAHQLADSLNPVDDDQATRNNIIVQRDGGSTARESLEEGALSILPPPLGVGKYDNTVSMNVLDDSRLPEYALWLLLLGTVDEARYPNVALNMRHSTFDDDTLHADAMFTDVGDRIVVSDVPAWLPPDDISQLVNGYAEKYTGQEHTLNLVCIPEAPYRVGELDDPNGVIDRLDTEDTTLNEALDSTETGVDVITNSGPRWVDSAGYASEFPFDVIVGGEVMRVTACSGTGLTQTFTVTRSINGVVKSHSSGADVRLLQPMIIAL